MKNDIIFINLIIINIGENKINENKLYYDY